MPTSSRAPKSTHFTGAKKLLPPTLGAILEFTEGDEQGREIPLFFERTVLGRKHADILVRDLKVSSTHAAVEYRGGKFRVIDLGSSNGTFLGPEKIKEVAVDENQKIRIGDTQFLLKLDPLRAAQLLEDQPIHLNPPPGGLSELLQREFANPIDPDQTVSLHSEPEKTATRLILLSVTAGCDQGKKFSFPKAQISIGRMNADVVLHDPDVSRKHAIVELGEGDQVVLRDLASANGSFVNDRQVETCRLVPNDRIRLGQTTLVFLGVRKT